MSEHSSSPPQVVSTTHVVYVVLRFLRVVRRHKAVLLVSLLVTGLLGVFYYATAERIYQAKAELLVQHKHPEVWSESIAKDGGRQGMLPTYERLFRSARVLDPAIELLESLPQEARIDLLPFPRDQWRDELRDRLRASAIRATDNIEVSFLSRNPRTAETVVNAVVESYQEYIEERHRTVAKDIADLLEVNLVEVERRLSEKTEELLRAKLAIKDIGIQGTEVVHPVVHRVDAVHAKLYEVVKRRIELEASFAALKNAMESGGDLKQHLLSLEPTVGQEVVLGVLGLSKKDSEVIADLQRMLFQEQAELDRLSARHLEQHPDVQSATARVAWLREEIKVYGQRQAEISGETYSQQLGGLLVSFVTEQLRTAWQHEQALRAEFEAAESDAVEVANQWQRIAILEKEEQRLRDLDASLQNRLDEIDIKRNQSDVEVAIVSDAWADDRPVSPRLLWVAFVCCSMGSCVGVAVIYVMDVLDDRFRSPEELKEQLGAPVLAIVRQLPENSELGTEGLHVHVAPDSVESEAFRTLRTTIAFAGEDLECMAISSSEPSDGKTTVLSNLGAALAQAGTRTLLIDADMRRPGLSSLFDVRSKKGLGDILSRDVDAGEAASRFVLSTSAANLDLLPAGIRPVDPTGMLSGARFAELLSWARANYDQTLIDTPPILAASDATIVGRLVDGLVLVVQPEKNNRRIVHRAAEEIHGSKLNFLGVVANRVGHAGVGYSGDYGYGYGYGPGYGYGHRYGHDAGHDAGEEPADQYASSTETIVEAGALREPAEPDESHLAGDADSPVVSQARIIPSRVGDRMIRPRRAA